METLTTTLELAITLADEPAAGDRTFTALGIPYDEDLQREDWNLGTRVMRWAQGSVTVPENNQVHYGHDWQTNGLPIGRIISAEQTPKGLVVTGYISETPKGDEVLTLMRDKVLTRVSAGLRTTAWHIEDDGQTLVHDESVAFETSIVPQPAYNTAAVTNVNSASGAEGSPTMNENTNTLAAEVRDLATTMETLQRQVETIPATLAAAATGPVVPFRRYGEFIKALARQDSQAIALSQYLALAVREQDETTTARLATLAYAGGTSADLGGYLKAGWIGDVMATMTANRPLHDFFSSSPLPATGMTVEYGKIATNSLTVAEQENEGDTLAYGKIAFSTGTAPVKTYGGYTEMTIQEIERSSMAVVEKAFAFMGLAYAKATEADLKALVQIAANSTPLAGSGVTDLATANGWNTFILRAAAQMQDAFGVSPEGLIVGYDVLETLVNMTEANANDKYLTRVNGSINITTMSGDVHSLKLIPVTGTAAGFVRVAHSQAVEVLGQANPTQLTADDPTNLTRALSVYGYEAQAPTAPALLIAPDTTA